jgi:hypothetical protein
MDAPHLSDGFIGWLSPESSLPRVGCSYVSLHSPKSRTALSRSCITHQAKSSLRPIAEATSWRWEWHRDNACKIAALGNKIVFVASGFDGYDSVGPHDRLPSWRASGEAHRAYAEVVGKGVLESILLAVAKKWGEFISSRISDLYTCRSKTVSAGAVDGLLTTAIFAAAETKGRLSAFVVQIRIVSDIGRIGFAPTSRGLLSRRSARLVRSVKVKSSLNLSNRQVRVPERKVRVGTRECGPLVWMRLIGSR